MTILIKNGRVLNPATKTDEILDLLIEDEYVAKLEKNITADADKVIDADGCFVMPGFIDLHVHFRDPGLTEKEDIFTGMAAAARGGYTTVLPMPNTKPVADCADVIEYVNNKVATDEKHINVMQVGAVTKGQQGQELSDIEGMYNAGCRSISEDGKSVMNANLYREAMKLAAKLDIPVLAHCEDITMVDGGCVNADEHTKALGLRGITNAVEDVIVARDILIAKETGARLHLCHCSTEDSVKMVKAAKAEGIPVSAEVCPHHFCMTSDEIADANDANYKMNPPLRTKADVDALIKGLSDGTMEVISTDHAPHTAEEKARPIDKAPFGIVGSETAACLTYTYLVKPGYLTPLQMAEKMSYNPARVLPIDKGDLQPGKIADVVVFNPNEIYEIDVNEFASKGKNTPFGGREVAGRVKYTICDGRIVFGE